MSINWKKWSGDRTLNFVLEYKKHSCLWDVHSEHYKDKNARDYALHSIARNLGGDSDIDIAAVRKKLRIIRSTYWNEHQKILKNRNLGKVYKSKIVWFELANSFLRNVIKWGDKIDNKANPEKDPCSPPLITRSESNNIDGVEELNNLEENPVEIKTESPHGNHSQRLRSKNISKRKRKKVNLSGAVRKLTHLANPAPEDQFDLFGKYIASQLRELPIQDALLCKEKVTSLILQQRLNAIEIEFAHLPPNFQIPKFSPPT